MQINNKKMFKQSFIFPKPLEIGDTISIITPSRSITSAEIEPFIDWISNKGFKIETGANINRVCGQFGGNDEERAKELQQAIDNPSVRAIWCARGGYGSARIIEKIDFKPLLKNPKWIVGFSDITAIHSALYGLGLVSLHAPMPLNFKNDTETVNSFETVCSYLTGNYTPLIWNKTVFDKEGKAEGRLFGGNLSVLYSLRGTPYDINHEKTIFYIEDIDEYLYHIDRICNNLNMSKIFSKITAFVSGSFTKMNDNVIPFGMSVQEILLQYLENVQVRAFDAPFGHINNNFPLINGALATLEVGKTSVKLSYNGTA